MQKLTFNATFLIVVLFLLVVIVILVLSRRNHLEHQEDEEDFDDFDDEEYNMYLDYQNKFRITGRSFWELVTNMDENGDIANKKFSKQEHTPEEYKRAYEKVTQMYEAYEERRMNFNNWQELYEEGNWDMSQNYVDRFARSVLNRVRKSAYSKAGRIYYAEDKQEGLMSIYICLRDIKSVDYFLDFRKKPKNKCRKR